MDMKRAGVALATFALVVAACSGGGADTTTSSEVQPAPADDAGETSITLVGENIAFDATRLTAPAGGQVTITFENRDNGIMHNLQLAAPSGSIATTIESGPVTQVLTFTIDEPGTYRYICQVHPTAMVGELVIEG